MVWFYGISTTEGYLMPNPLSTYISNIKDLVWFSLVLWHVNHYRLFNAKSSFCIYIKYLGFVLVWFYGLFNANSSFYIYISNIYDL